MWMRGKWMYSSSSYNKKNMYISFNWCFKKIFLSIFCLLKPEMCIWSCEIFSLSSRKKKKTETTHENKDLKKFKIVPFKAEKTKTHLHPAAAAPDTHRTSGGTWSIIFYRKVATLGFQTLSVTQTSCQAALTHFHRPHTTLRFILHTCISDISDISSAVRDYLLTIYPSLGGKSLKM